MKTLRIEPERDIESRDGVWVATGTEPWLKIANPPLGLAGRFVSLETRLGALDYPARPVVRFTLRDGRRVEFLGCGSLQQSCVWTGRMPFGTVSVSISPTNRPGPFRFELLAIRKRHLVGLLLEGWRLNRRSTRSAVLTRLIGWRPESDMNLKWAVSAQPLRSLACSRGAPDVGRVEDRRPRGDLGPEPPIWLVVGGETSDAALLRTTLTSITAQSFGNWSAFVTGPAAGAQLRDRRISYGSIEDCRDVASRTPAGTLVGFLGAGDRLADRALEIIAEQRHREPSARLFYGDECRGADKTPHLKPGWSPRLQARSPYLGRAVFAKDPGAWPPSGREAFLARGEIDASVTEMLGGEVAAVRRILVESDASEPSLAPRRTEPRPRPGAKASIIIPTRDHPDLLRRAVTSIRVHSRPGSFDIVVVDNGSAGPDARRALRDLSAAGDLRVIDHPAPFNFSQICNDAARTCSTDVLVFLNDDVEVLSDDWLDLLVAHATDPTIGAIGAKLTYPDGRIQHIGVVAGMGESAGHFGALTASDDPGWVGRNGVVHEIAAVTGACLAVARAKFEAVGGFDAKDLPIELSDIDLCFKLNARGWQTIVDPAVHLMHEESASRGGATFRRLDVYNSQRAVFVERWRHVLRDDPFFHPCLSLYSHIPALG